MQQQGGGRHLSDHCGKKTERKEKEAAMIDGKDLEPGCVQKHFHRFWICGGGGGGGGGEPQKYPCDCSYPEIYTYERKRTSSEMLSLKPDSVGSG